MNLKHMTFAVALTAAGAWADATVYDWTLAADKTTGDLNVAAGVKLPSGVYPLITAQSIAGTPSARPVVTADRPYNMKIVATGTTVDLLVLPRGMMIRVK